MLKKHQISLYQKPTNVFWTGRTIDPTLGNQYWYQAIQLIDLETDSLQNINKQIAILGFAIDEGVKRNQGRIGAAKGPNAIRTKLGKIALHTAAKLIDFGNIICLDEDLETSHEVFSNIISEIINNDIFPIALGGGHDIAFASFKGIWDSKLLNTNKKIGIINFDAHLDLRPVLDKPNSGTPFFQIFRDFNDNEQVKYCIIGLQKQSNTKELLSIAESKNVLIIESFECETFNTNHIIKQLQIFINELDYLYITIDMDVFSSAYVTGVSAPSPLGIQPNVIFPILTFLLASKKVILCDIAELNPKYDDHELSANLSARLVDFIVNNLYE